MRPTSEVLSGFLLAYPALFSIVNPIAGALIFDRVTADRPHSERARLAGKVGLFSLAVMIGAVWIGPYLLAFFGISIAALRIGGGLVVSMFALELLTAPEKKAIQKEQQVGAPAPSDDIAFFPLTLPLTTGPGTISVAITLGVGRPVESFFLVGVTLAAVAMALTIGTGYRYADRLAALLGAHGEKTLTRLAAFLLFCIGVQIVITGLTEVVTPMIHG